MCGIAGYVGTRRIEEERLRHCLQLMHRRGPDHGAWREFEPAAGRRVYLLNTRLDIIDLHERANQPLSVGPLTITYNGELYNYLELRRELEARGERFATASDTEVLVRLLGTDGLGALDRSEGMWAFALYDETDGRIVLARDRFGEKPLYVHRGADGLTFASEPKFVAALLGRRLDVDFEQVRRFLGSGYRSLYKDGRTFFRELEEVPAATTVSIAADGSESAAAYWSPAHGEQDAMGYEEAVRGARDRLIRSVELRLRADVPLAFCLSGGVDSTVLISIARRVLGHDVHGFTVVTGDERYDESDAVEQTVADLAIRHTKVPLESHDFLSRLRELVCYHDAPVYTVSYYVHSRLMEAVARGDYRVSVSGTGADELFTGYYDHHLAYLAVTRDEGARAAWEQHVLPLVRNEALRDPDLFVRDRAFRGHLYDGVDPASFTERELSGDLLRNRMLNELIDEVVPVILHEDDLNAMYYSIENRSPYLDRSLADFCNTIPTRHLIRDGFAKAVLRDAGRGIAPDHVVAARRKVGFNAPVAELLDADDAGVRGALLADNPVFDLVDRDWFERLLTKRPLADRENKLLFSIVSAMLFLEEFA